jgi:hypothetical protein
MNLHSPALSDLIARAPESAAAEARFLAAFLEERVYALRPLSDDHPRVRLTMFTNSEGWHFIPLFADEAKALLSAQRQLRVISLRGSEMLQVTTGAVIVVNPNDEHCSFSPRIGCPT